MAAFGPLAPAIAAFAVPTAAQLASPLPAETLLNREILKALDEELSGVAAKDHVSRLAQLHPVPASPGFHEAIEYVMDRAKAFGLADVHVETFPSDGITWFGTLHGSRGWRVDGATTMVRTFAASLSCATLRPRHGIARRSKSTAPPA